MFCFFLKANLSDLRNIDNNKYLKEFGEHFQKAVLESVENNLRENENLTRDDMEILHNCFFFNKLLQKFQEREEYSQKVLY